MNELMFDRESNPNHRDSPSSERFGTLEPGTIRGDFESLDGAPANENSAASPMRDARWMAEFMCQATDRLRRNALRYAKRRAYMVAQHGGRTDSSYAEELVEDVLADTLIGVLSWRPDSASLERHVWLAIQSRSRHDRDRAEVFPHMTLDAANDDDDDDQEHALLAEAEGALAATRATCDVERAFSAAEVVARLRVLADGDVEVVAMLDAVSRGATERAELMEVLAIDASVYDRVRHRLDRLLGELPHACVPHAFRGAPRVS